MLGTSAWYAPGAAVSSLVQAIGTINIKCSHVQPFLMENMDETDYVIGTVILGKNGIEKIVEIDLVMRKKKNLSESASGVKATNNLLNEYIALENYILYGEDHLIETSNILLF